MKILCFGDTQGDFRRTFEKVGLLQKKQAFDYLLCLGDLFTADIKDEDLDSLLSSQVKVTLPTYFYKGPLGLPPRIVEAAGESGQVCDNLFLLGEFGQLQVSDGPNLSYYSTNEDESDSGRLQSLRRSDILLTLRGPTFVPPALIVRSGPKYLFYPSADYVERAPYKLQNSAGEQCIVREIGLGPVANAKKSKWFYAFNLTDTKPDAAALTAAEACPHLPTASKEVAADTQVEAITTVDMKSTLKRPPEGYICKICSTPGDHYFKECPERSQSRKRKRGQDVPATKFVDPSSCFFCLSNPNLARHLIVSIGDNGTYMVLPKGGMTQNHVIILPIDHKPTMASLADSRESVQAEMERYIDALEKYYESMNMVGIVFEISRASGIHFHVQMMPVPAEKLKDLEAAFFAFAETEDLTLENKSPNPDDGDFFRVRFPSTQTSLMGYLAAKKRFDLQFGRRVISDVMGVPSRAHWKDCLRTEEQEKADAELFKTSFKPFDFTL